MHDRANSYGEQMTKGFIGEALPSFGTCSIPIIVAIDVGAGKTDYELWPTACVSVRVNVVLCLVWWTGKDERNIY